MDTKLISIDIQADFGFFRKPDANNTIHLSYNIIHKPAVLGILGAIIGLKGYVKKGEFPEYYTILEDLKVGIQPLDSDKGNYLKTNIKYSNTIGYANKQTNYLTEELTLVKPKYRIYLLLNLNDEYNNRILDYLREGKSEYIPYFGKNEYHSWWTKDSYKEYEFTEGLQDCEESILVNSIFEKNIIFKDNKEKIPIVDFFSNSSINETPFVYFERLPKGFNKELFQYKIADFVYSTFKIKNACNIESLYYLKQEKAYVQML